MNQVQSNIVVAEYDPFDPLISFNIGEQNGQKATARIQITLDSKCLITVTKIQYYKHVVMTCNEKDLISKYFHYQYSESVDQFEPRLNKSQQNTDALIYSVLHVTKKFRLIFNLEDKNIKDLKEFEDMFKMSVNKVIIFGYHLYTTPPSNQMVCILNASHFLKMQLQEMSAADADILLGLCLISSRRFLQATEIFKKVAQLYASKSLTQENEHSEYLLLMAASLQILVADSINQPSMINEKLQSLITCVRYTNKKIDFSINQDMYDCILRIHHDLIKVICKILPSKIPFEALKLAHLRCLEFLIEQLGCGLGEQIIGLIRLLSKNFSQCSPYLSTMYLKLLNNLLQIIQFASNQFKIQLWAELIEEELFQNYDQEIKLYYIKLAEYLIELTGGELPLSLYFVNQITHSNDNHYQKLWQYLIDHTIKFQTAKKIQKILYSSQNWLNDIIEFQVFSLENISQVILVNKIIILTKNSLIRLNSEQVFEKDTYIKQTLSNIMSTYLYDKYQLKQIYGEGQEIELRQFISNIKPTNKYTKILTLVSCIQENQSRTFYNITGQFCVGQFNYLLIQIQIYQLGDKLLSDLLMPYLNQILDFCRNSMPQIEQLKLIQIILKNLKPFLNEPLQRFFVNFLNVFCGCIPHSIYDDTFQIFDQLIEFTIDKIETESIERSILALIDQYTVKGKAQKFSKQFLIKKLCQQSNHLLNIITICLYGNQEPKLKKDGKLFAQEYEIFVEKLTIVQEAFMEIEFDLLKLIIRQLSLSDRMQPCLSNLLRSQNSKIRWKGLNILKIYYDNFVKSQLLIQKKDTNQHFQDLIENTQSINDKRYNFQSSEQLQFLYNFLKLLHDTLQDPKDEKSQLQSLMLVEQIFSSLLYHAEIDGYLSFCDQSQSQDSQSSETVLQMILDIWDHVIQFTNSHWNSISTVVQSIIQSWAKFQDNFDESASYQIFISRMVQWITYSLQKTESNSLINTLQICGTFLGLRVSQFMVQNPEKSFQYFKRYQKYISQNFWEPICKLQQHKNYNIKMMSICIIQCCSPTQISQSWFNQRFNQITNEDTLLSPMRLKNSQNFLTNISPQGILIPTLQAAQDLVLQSDTVCSQHDQGQGNHMWLAMNIEHLVYILGVLFEEIRTLTSFWNDDLRNLVIDDEVDQQNNSFKEEKIVKVPYLDDDPLDFDELGIIEVDDEEWNEYDDLKKVPILKGKNKNISNQQFKKEELQINRKWSGKQRGNDTNIDSKSQSDDMKLLRPHNPLFRPLTPPIGSNNNPQLMNNMELFQNYALQNPDEFQKLIDGIKHQQGSSEGIDQKEKYNNQSKQEQYNKLVRPQSRLQRPQSSEFPVAQRYISQTQTIVPIVNDEYEQELYFQERKVDELEYDPTFSKSNKINIEEDQKSNNKKENKIKKRKKLDTNHTVSTQLSFKDLRKLWELSINKKKQKGELSHPKMVFQFQNITSNCSRNNTNNNNNNSRSHNNSNNNKQGLTSVVQKKNYDKQLYDQIKLQRGLIYQQTTDEIPTTVSNYGIYCGFDPTAKSLHLGNLFAILMLARFSKFGYTPIGLIGGATGLIGDPSGKNIERELQESNKISINSELIELQVKNILHNALKITKVQIQPKIINNIKFYNEMKVLDFLRDVGRYFRMSSLLGKDHVQSRLTGGDGISYTEFSYTLLQSYDFLRLFEDHQCTIQIGGSDQWGNITNGCDLVRRVHNKQVYGITTPLLVNKQGQKFGKSEGNAIFLDQKEQVHQYLLNQSDDVVEDLLKKLTFLEQQDITDIMVQHNQKPNQRTAQIVLSEKIQEIIFGSVSENFLMKLFNCDFNQLSEMDDSQRDGYFLDQDISLVQEEDSRLNIVDLLHKIGLRQSKSDIKRLIDNGGVYMNGKRLTKKDTQFEYIGRYSVLRIGKKEFKLMKKSY